jgi:hypothetical protein
LAQTLANQVLVEHFYCSPLFTPSAGARVHRGECSTGGARLHSGIQAMRGAGDIPQTDHVPLDNSEDLKIVRTQP